MDPVGRLLLRQSQFGAWGPHGGFSFPPGILATQPWPAQIYEVPMGGAAVSVEVGSATARPSADALLTLLRPLVAERGGDDAWSTVVDDAWCHVTPVGQAIRPQGWKLH